MLNSEIVSTSGMVEIGSVRVVFVFLSITSRFVSCYCIGSEFPNFKFSWWICNYIQLRL